MTEIRLTLPLPDKILSPNARSHWAVKARAKRSARESARLRTLKALREAGRQPPKWRRAAVELVFYWPTRHTRDRDNALASMKAALDGIADAGVVEDDAGFVPWPADMRHDRDRPRVEITITRLRASENGND